MAMTTARVQEGARPRLVTALVLVVILVAVGWLLRDGDDAPVVVVQVPSPGEVLDEQLDDGTPVWVSQDQDGQVAVLEALTPSTGPIGGMVGWCEDGQRFVDPHMGLTFGPNGSRYNGLVPGRASPHAPTVGLTPRTIQVAGQAQPGDPVLVAQPVPPSTDKVDPPLRGELAHGPPASCRRPERRIGGTDTASLTGLRDHARRRQPLDISVPGWQIGDGWLQFGPSGNAQWCEGSLTNRGNSTCTGGDVIDVTVRVPTDAAASITTVIGDPLAVQVDEEGRIVKAAVLPTSTWAGSSLQPSATYRLDYLAPDVGSSRLLVHSADGKRCVSAAPAILGMSPDTSVIYIDVDTRLDIRGATTVDDLRRVGVPATGLAVDVVVDGITCRALAVRDVS